LVVLPPADVVRPAHAKRGRVGVTRVAVQGAHPVPPPGASRVSARWAA